MKNKYYVYIYLDPRRPGEYIYESLRFFYEPFYVGKGSGERYRDHLTNAYNNYDSRGKDHNKYKCSKIRKIKKDFDREPIIELIKHFDSEIEAFKYERYCISIIGRMGIGPLCNMTDGGEGYSPDVNTKNKLSIINTGNKHPQYKHLDKEIIDTIIKLYVEENKRFKEIANILNLNENKIKKTLIENNIELKKRKPPINFISITSEQIEAVINLYKNNISIRDISKQLKWPFDKVRKIIKENNMTRHSGFIRTETHWINQSNARKGKYAGQNSSSYITLSQDEVELIIKYYNDGMPRHKIAKRLGYSPTKITSELKRLKLI